MKMEKTLTVGCSIILCSMALFISIVLYFVLCDDSRNVGVAENAYTEEQMYDWASQYNFNSQIDTAEAKTTNIKIHHIRESGFEGVGRELSDSHYMVYDGMEVYYISSEQLHDGIVAKDKMITIGTYSKDGSNLPILCTVKTYRSLIDSRWIKKIQNIQKSNIQNK